MSCFLVHLTMVKVLNVCPWATHVHYALLKFKLCVEWRSERLLMTVNSSWNTRDLELETFGKSHSSRSRVESLQQFTLIVHECHSTKSQLCPKEVAAG